MFYIYATALTLLNLVFWFSILFNLPGIWLMVISAVLLEWSQPGEYMFGWPVLYAAGGLALLAEVAEFLLGAAGARQAGGSKRGALLAIVGGVVGAIVGTALLLPVIGTLLGACVGAFAGSLLGDRWAGRSIEHSVQAGRGAAVGRFWGTTTKMILGGVVVAMLAVAAFR